MMPQNREMLHSAFPRTQAFIEDTAYLSHMGSTEKMVAAKVHHSPLNLPKPSS